LRPVLFLDYNNVSSGGQEKARFMKQILDNQKLSSRELRLVHHMRLHEYYRCMAATEIAQSGSLADGERTQSQAEYHRDAEHHLDMARQFAAALGPPFDPQPDDDAKTPCRSSSRSVD
jgi:hypothetical protein